MALCDCNKEIDQLNLLDSLILGGMIYKIAEMLLCRIIKLKKPTVVRE